MAKYKTRGYPRAWGLEELLLGGPRPKPRARSEAHAQRQQHPRGVIPRLSPVGARGCSKSFPWGPACTPIRHAHRQDASSSHRQDTPQGWSSVRGSRGSCEICCRGQSGRETCGRGPGAGTGLVILASGSRAHGRGSGQASPVQPCPWPWSSGNPAAACVSPCPLRLRVNHWALELTLECPGCPLHPCASSGPGHPHAEQACVPPWAPARMEAQEPVQSGPAGQPHRRHQGARQDPQQLRPSARRRRWKAWKPARRRPSREELGWDSAKETCGAEAEDGAWGEAASQEWAWPCEWTGRFQRRRGLDRAAGSRLQDGPCTHT